MIDAVKVKFTGSEKVEIFHDVKRIKQNFFTGLILIEHKSQNETIIPHGKYDYMTIGRAVEVVQK